MWLIVANTIKYMQKELRYQLPAPLASLLSRRAGPAAAGRPRLQGYLSAARLLMVNPEMHALGPNDRGTSGRS